MRSVRFHAGMEVWLPGAESAIALAAYFESVVGDASFTPSAAGSQKFVSELRELITGEPKDAALGVMHYMNLPSVPAHLNEMARGCDAIRAEFDMLLARANARLFDAATEGDEARQAALDAQQQAELANECMRYVLDEAAGSSSRVFPNSPFPRDCDAHGVRADRCVGGTTTTSGQPMRLADFCETVEACTAKLEMAHVAAIRIYSTAAYLVLNQPLRDQARTAPHPLPVTISFLTAAIGKLRALGASASGARQSLDLWRGLRDVSLSEAFSQHGGTELAPMSTTSKLEVALHYSLSENSLLFKLRTDSFMQRGASITFVSAFPDEEEVLFPPLSYLNPTTKTEVLRVAEYEVQVVEVVPHFGSA